MLLKTRDSVKIFEDSIPTTPRRVEIVKEQAITLLEMGIAPKNLMTAANLLNNYVRSFVADELRIMNRPSEDMQSFIKMLSSDDYPFYYSNDSESQFLYGLKVLISGLETIDD